MLGSTSITRTRSMLALHPISVQEPSTPQFSVRWTTKNMAALGQKIDGNENDRDGQVAVVLGDRDAGFVIIHPTDGE